MSRVAAIALIALSLVAAVAVAQPIVNAPLLTRHSFVQSSNSNYAQTELVILNGWAFTATADGIYAMNLTTPTSESNRMQWFDSWGTTQVTTMFGLYNSSMLVAIGGGTIVLYGVNNTNVWRKAWFMTPNATFNIQTYTNYVKQTTYPIVEGGMMFIGTGNTSASSWSTVYAFNLADLSVAWSTQVNYQYTNYAPAWNNGSSYIWFLGYNGGNYRLLAFWASNGTQWGTAINTGVSSNFGAIGIKGDTLAFFASSGYVYFYSASNSSQLYTYSMSSCGNMPYPPVTVNTTWYVVCDSRILMFSSAPAYLSTFSASSTITAGALHQGDNDVILAAGRYVYLINGSASVSLLTSFPNSMGGNSVTAVGVSFDWSWNASSPVNRIVHISYAPYWSTDSGVILSLDYLTGKVIAQAAGNVNPIGRAWFDPWTRRLVTASQTSSAILQTYDIVMGEWMNSTSFVAQISSSNSYLSYPLAYNWTNRTTYFATTYSLWAVDQWGNTWKAASYSSYTSSNVPPIMVGRFVCVPNTYSSSQIQCYDTVAQTLLSPISTPCDPSTYVMPIVQGATVYVVCQSSSSAAGYMVNTAATSPTAVTIGTASYSGYGAVVSGKWFIVVSGSSEVSAWDVTQSPPKQAWKTTSSQLLSITSGLTASSMSVFVTAYYPALSAYPGQQGLFSISLASGSVTGVARLTGNSDASYKRVQYMSGGVFGSGVVYVMGYYNVSAISAAGGATWFNTKYPNGTYSIPIGRSEPKVLPTGAIAVYTWDGYFNIFGGFKGALAWRYAASTNSYQYPIQTDNRSVYFTSGSNVVGADIYTGVINSQTAYGRTTLNGFVLAPGIGNSTTVVASTNYYVYAAEAPFYASPAGANPTFPGSGGGAGGDGGSSSGSKAWIAGVVIGILVVIVLIGVLSKRSSASASQGTDYVPMNPSTQV